MTPNEAWHCNDNTKFKMMKSQENKYAKEFKKGIREKFIEDQEVYIEKTKCVSNPKCESKFDKKGKIIKVIGITVSMNLPLPEAAKSGL